MGFSSEYSTDQPIVLCEYLVKLPEILDELGLEVTPNDPSSENELRRRLARVWNHGRNHLKLERYQRELRKHKITHKSVAEDLGVSPAAVGHWFSGDRGIEPHNLRLLERKFDAVFRQCRVPSRHELDLCGYQRTVSYLGCDTLAESKRIDDFEFWCIWFLLRNRAWLAAKQQSDPRAKDLAASHIRKSVEGMCPDGVVSVPRLDDVERRWASAFVVTVEYLDAMCWTKPAWLPDSTIAPSMPAPSHR